MLNQRSVGQSLKQYPIISGPEFRCSRIFNW